MPEARADRDQAMASVSDNAGADFNEAACAFITAYLLSRGATAGEDLTDACKRSGIVPHDDRAFGPVYMRLSREGVIEKAGYVPRRKGHGTGGGSVWRLANATGHGRGIPRTVDPIETPLKRWISAAEVLSFAQRGDNRRRLPAQNQIVLICPDRKTTET